MAIKNPYPAVTSGIFLRNILRNQYTTTMKKGTFISIWDNGSFRTPAILNEATGEVTTTSVDVSDDIGTLMEESFEDEEGDEYDICPECHEYILKTVMKEGVGKHLYEAQVCSNPECDNQ
ncbi:MAG: hypothetical protein WC333_02110 [Dehalococcoidia bacterium]